MTRVRSLAMPLTIAAVIAVSPARADTLREALARAYLRTWLLGAVPLLVGMVALGIVFMPIDIWLKGYFAMGTAMLIQSCVTMTKTVRDAAIMLGAMASVDPKDSTSADRPVPDYEAALTGDIRGKRVGIPREYRMDGMSAEIDALWKQGAEMLRDAGAEIVDISLPHTKYALPAYYVIAPAEASSNLARYDGVRYGQRDLPDGAGLQDMYAATRAAGFGDEVKRRILLGTYALSSGYYDAYYGSAQKVRRLIANDFQAAFEHVDVLLSPTAPTTAFPLGDKLDDPMAMYLNDVATIPANLAGVPGLSLPSGLADEDGLPAGLRQADKLRAGLLNAISHDFRTPLALLHEAITFIDPLSQSERQFFSSQDLRTTIE